jgi:hypothetical protein
VTDTIEPTAAQIDQQRLARDLVDQAGAEGVQLVGGGGLLTGLTKAVVETALEEEISWSAALRLRTPRRTRRTPQSRRFRRPAHRLLSPPKRQRLTNKLQRAQAQSQSAVDALEGVQRPRRPAGHVL